MSHPKLVSFLATTLILISLLCRAVPATSAAADRIPLETVDQEKIDAYTGALRGIGMRYSPFSPTWEKGARGMKGKRTVDMHDSLSERYWAWGTHASTRPPPQARRLLAHRCCARVR